MPIGIVATERFYCNKCSEWKPETDFSLVARAQSRVDDENALCQECVDKLFKGRLGRNEVNAYIKEDRDRMLQRTRNPEFEEMTGERRLGRVMHSNEFLPRLQKIVPNLVIWPGCRGNDLSLYRIYGDQVDFICWTGQKYLPEFSIVEFNKDRQPINEIRGWRTVLLRVIKFGLLTEKQAEREFGRPSSPQEARYWDRQLWNLRNDRTTLKDN
jgi:hypothetical protein